MSDCKTCADYDSANSYCPKYCDVIQKTLDEQTRWIPVSERLPKFDEKVLAFVKNKDPKGRFNENGIYVAKLKDKVPEHDPEGKKNIWGIPGYDSKWTVWAWSYFTEPDVVAWMPLPKPWRGTT